MKAKRVYDAVTCLPADLIMKAGAHKFKKRPKKALFLSAVAAALVLAVAAGALLFPVHTPQVLPGAVAEEIERAQFPASVPYPKDEEMFTEAYFDKYDTWIQDLHSRRLAPGTADSLQPFFQNSAKTFLSDTDGENAVFSPVNLYAALCMLAEITGGDSHAQVLGVLGQSDTEEMRLQAQKILLSIYRDDGVQTCLPAAAVFLNDRIDFKPEALSNLAEGYYASSYRGEMGSSEMNALFQSWLDENTGGLLAEYAREKTLEADTVLALASALYVNVGWESRFSPEATVRGEFYAPGETVQADYMKKSAIGTYYRGENFSAVYFAFEGDGGMWFFLPDEGTEPERLLDSEEIYRLMDDSGAHENAVRAKIHSSVPKFDITGEIDLIEGLRSLGITDVFRADLSDFTPLTELKEIYVNKAEQNARIKIDEEGVLGAAFTIMTVRATGALLPQEEIHFTLNRPFLFVAASPDNIPLFMGVVNKP